MEILTARKSVPGYIDEVGFVRGVGHVVVESLRVIVHVEHVTRLVLHVDDLVTCDSQHWASSFLRLIE